MPAAWCLTAWRERRSTSAESQALASSPVLRAVLLHPALPPLESASSAGDGEDRRPRIGCSPTITGVLVMDSITRMGSGRGIRGIRRKKQSNEGRRERDRGLIHILLIACRLPSGCWDLYIIRSILAHNSVRLERAQPRYNTAHADIQTLARALSLLGRDTPPLLKFSLTPSWCFRKTPSKILCFFPCCQLWRKKRPLTVEEPFWMNLLSRNFSGNSLVNGSVHKAERSECITVIRGMCHFS